LFVTCASTGLAIVKLKAMKAWRSMDMIFPNGEAAVAGKRATLLSEY